MHQVRLKNFLKILPMVTKTTVKEKTFPKQATVEISPYATKEETAKNRVVKDIGFGIETPKTAYENYYDKKCPFTGDVTVRGRIFKGQVVKMKAEKTIVIAIKYLFFDPKYKRYARRNAKMNVHLSPCWNGLVQVGDVVTCGETRPLSKTKSSVVIAVAKKSDDKNVKTLSI